MNVAIQLSWKSEYYSFASWRLQKYNEFVLCCSRNVSDLISETSAVITLASCFYCHVLQKSNEAGMLCFVVVFYRCSQT